MDEKQKLSDELLSDFIFRVVSAFSAIDEWRKKLEKIEKDRQLLDKSHLSAMTNATRAILKNKGDIESLVNICKNYERTYNNQKRSIKYLVIALIIVTAINILHVAIPLVLKLFCS